MLQIFPQKLLSQSHSAIDKVISDLLLQFVIFKKKKKSENGMGN